MKKEYMKSAMRVVKVKMCQLLVESVTGLSNSVGLEYGGGGSGTGRSRDYDDWDDDWSE